MNPKEATDKVVGKVRSNRTVILIILGLLFIITCLIGMLTAADKVEVVEAASVPEVAKIQEADVATIVEEVGSKEQPDNKTTCEFSKKVPKAVRQWRDLIGKYAQKFGLECNLIAAIITQESGGNPNAYSSSGAVGLMQVMPSDGLSYQLFGNMFQDRPTTQELYDPETNILTGCRIFSTKLKENDGDTRLALMAYGPMDNKAFYARTVLGYYRKFNK